VAVALVRIDDRLVHGQVVVGWIPHLNADEILVVSEAASKDETQVTLMQLALPEQVSLKVKGFRDAADYLQTDEARIRNILVLTPGPFEVLGLLDKGARFDHVNVGGLHYTAGRVQLGKAIFLSELDKEALREIGRRGVRLEGRAIPSDAELDILKMIGEYRA
jgi:mannose PTS system EIIA component